MSDTTEKKWAIVELFGHARVAGALSEESIGGGTFLRVDVPDVPAGTRDLEYAGSRPMPAIPAHTKHVGAAAVYAINWVDELAARIAAANIRHVPVQTYSLRDAAEALSEDDRARLLGNLGRPALGGPA